MSERKLLPFVVVGTTTGVEGFYADRDTAEESAAYWSEAKPEDPHVVYVLLEECQHVS